MSLRIKITIAIVFASLSLLLLSLVAPKAKAYDESTFTSISYGKTPSELILWARTFTSDSRKDYDNNIVYVYTYGDRCFAYVYFLDDSITAINCPTNSWGNPTSNVSAFCVEFNYYRNFSVSSHGASNRIVSFDGENHHISPNYGNIWTNKITLTFDNGSVTPPVSFKDGYSVTPRGWTFSYDVYPLPTSEHIAWYYQTRKYIARISATYNGQPITLDIPNYLSWSPSTKLSPLVEPFAKDENGAIKPVFQLTTTSAESSVEPYFQNVMYYKFDGEDDNLANPSMVAPDRDYTSDNATHWVDSSVNEMSLSLYNLLQAFRKAYPDYTFADTWLYQDFSLSFIGYDDNKTYFTQVLPYSVVSDRTEPPPNVNTNQPDWVLDDRDTIINYIENDKTYDYLTTLPNSYLPPRTLETPDYSNLSTVPTPSYSFTPISLSGEDMDFWHWLVNYIYDSPALSIVFIASLGFLVCKVVIH